MHFNDYQHKARETAVYTHEYYPFASLVIEAAEFADLATKPMLRGDNKIIERSEAISEAGDVLWNLANACADIGITLEEVASYNIRKLKDREKRGVIKGDGGNR